MTEQEAIKKFKDRLAIPDYKEQIPEWYEAMELAVKSMIKLGVYESTGITPNQIREIDKLYLEKCQEVNELKTELEQMAAVKDIMVRTASAAVCGIGGGAC